MKKLECDLSDVVTANVENKFVYIREDGNNLIIFTEEEYRNLLAFVRRPDVQAALGWKVEKAKNEWDEYAKSVMVSLISLGVTSKRIAELAADVAGENLMKQTSTLAMLAELERK